MQTIHTNYMQYSNTYRMQTIKTVHCSVNALIRQNIVSWLVDKYVNLQTIYVACDYSYLST